MESLLGRTSRLLVRRLEGDTAWLAAAEEDEHLVPIPIRELPSPTAVGAEVDVFVHLDSSDRPVATTRRPRLELGEVDVLTVADVAPFGAFVSWGLGKDLLVPLKEQTRPMTVGQRYAVGLYLDRTGRLAGTMRVAEMLRGDRRFAPDEWAEGVAWREEPGLGLFVILEKRSLGLLPAVEPHALRPGDAAAFRIAHVHPDGKVEVSLRRPKEDEIDEDATRLLALLAGPHPPQLGDGSSPERIRAVVGISKKAFKRAAGRLLRTRRAVLDEAGFLRVATPSG